MKAYISVSFSKREILDNEINSIVEIVKKFNIIPFVFVDKYKFQSNQEKEMMIQAMIDIDDCGILIAETSEKGIGIGIEVGYAKAKEKIVIYIRNINAEHSTTVSGISDFQIIYENNDDLQIKLTKLINKLELAIKQ